MCFENHVGMSSLKGYGVWQFALDLLVVFESVRPLIVNGRVHGLHGTRFQEDPSANSASVTVATRTLDGRYIRCLSSLVGQVGSSLEGK